VRFCEQTSVQQRVLEAKSRAGITAPHWKWRACCTTPTGWRQRWYVLRHAVSV